MLLDTLLIFGNGYFSLFKHNHLIGTSVLCDDLHKLKLDGLYDVTKFLDKLSI